MNKFFGQTIELSEQHPIKIHDKRHGVCVLACPAKQAVALCCERLACRDMNGLWQLPGGAIEPMESAEEAASRELYEEALIYVPPACMTYVGTYVQVNSDSEVFVTKAFACTVPNVCAADVDPRHGPWAWLTYDQLLARRIIPVIKNVIGWKLQNDAARKQIEDLRKGTQ